jgi:hypothetical protein
MSDTSEAAAALTALGSSAANDNDKTETQTEDTRRSRRKRVTRQEEEEVEDEAPSKKKKKGGGSDSEKLVKALELIQVYKRNQRKYEAAALTGDEYVSELKETICEHEATIKDMQKDIKQLRADKEELRKRCNSFSKDDLNKKIKALKEEVDSLDKQLRVKNREISTVDAKVVSLDTLYKQEKRVHGVTTTALGKTKAGMKKAKAALKVEFDLVKAASKGGPSEADKRETELFKAQVQIDKQRTITDMKYSKQKEDSKARYCRFDDIGGGLGGNMASAPAVPVFRGTHGRYNDTRNRIASGKIASRSLCLRILRMDPIVLEDWTVDAPTSVRAPHLVHAMMNDGTRLLLVSDATTTMIMSTAVVMVMTVGTTDKADSDRTPTTTTTVVAVAAVAVAAIAVAAIASSPIKTSLPFAVIVLLRSIKMMGTPAVLVRLKDGALSKLVGTIYRKLVIHRTG